MSYHQAQGGLIDDIGGALKNIGGAIKSGYDKTQEARVREEIMKQQLAAQAAAQQPYGQQSFMDKYGTFVLLGGAGVLAYILLRKK